MDDLYLRQDKMEINNDQSVVIVGVGGIGFNVGLQLVMSGVKKITVFDGDFLESHNMNKLPIPFSYIGMNKAEVFERFSEKVRPECDITAVPGEFNEFLVPNNANWIVDCTDKLSVQREIKKVADELDVKYLKAGYDGEDMSIHNNLPPSMWSETGGEGSGGYTIVQSWVCPAFIVSALTVAKILKYNDNEFGGNVYGLFRNLG